MEEIKKEELSIECLNKSIEKLENKVLEIAEDINANCKLMGVTLILEIFILIFFLVEIKGV